MIPNIGIDFQKGEGYDLLYMSIWENLRNCYNPKPIEKKAEFNTEFVSSEFVDLYIKTAMALDMEFDEAVDQLKQLENAYTAK